MTREKAVIIVVGNDRPGIIAAISGRLAGVDVNILDITQTTMHGLFTMITLADITECAVSFNELATSLEQTGRGIGVSVAVWHEDIFNAMHRI